MLLCFTLSLGLWVVTGCLPGDPSAPGFLLWAGSEERRGLFLPSLPGQVQQLVTLAWPDLLTVAG